MSSVCVLPPSPSGMGGGGMGRDLSVSMRAGMGVSGIAVVSHTTGLSYYRHSDFVLPTQHMLYDAPHTWVIRVSIDNTNQPPLTIHCSPAHLASRFSVYLHHPLSPHTLRALSFNARITAFNQLEFHVDLKGTEQYWNTDGVKVHVHFSTIARADVEDSEGSTSTSTTTYTPALPSSPSHAHSPSSPDGKPIKGSPAHVMVESKAAVEGRQKWRRLNDWVPIGLGAFGATYLVCDYSNGDRFSADESPDVANSRTVFCLKETYARGRMEEMRTLLRLQHHKSFIKMYDCFLDDVSGKLCIVTLYYQGGDLERLLRAQKLRKRLTQNQSDTLLSHSLPSYHISEERLRSWLRQLLECLVELQKHHIYHLDIAPRNIFFSDDKFDDLIVGDLGVAKANQYGPSAFYFDSLCPDLLHAPYQPYDTTDSWCVGAVLLECMVLDSVDDVSRLDQQQLETYVWRLKLTHAELPYSEMLWQLVLEMLARHPADRLSAAAALHRLNEMESRDAHMTAFRQALRIDITMEHTTTGRREKTKQPLSSSRSTIQSRYAAFDSLPAYTPPDPHSTRIPTTYRTPRMPITEAPPSPSGEWKERERDMGDDGESVLRSMSARSLSSLSDDWNDPLLTSPFLTSRESRVHSQTERKQEDERKSQKRSGQAGSMALYEIDTAVPSQADGGGRSGRAADQWSGDMGERASLLPATSTGRIPSFFEFAIHPTSWSILFDALDTLIPTTLKNSRPYHLHHLNAYQYMQHYRTLFTARFAVVISLVSLLVGVWGIISFLAKEDDDYLVLGGIIFYLLFSVLTLGVFKYSRVKTLDYIGHLVTTQLYLLLLYAAYQTGGVGSGFWLVLVCVPTCTLILQTPYGGVLWCSLVVALMITLTVLHNHADVSFPHVPTSGTEHDSLIPIGLFLLLIQFLTALIMSRYHSLTALHLSLSLQSASEARDNLHRIGLRRMKFLKSMGQDIMRPQYQVLGALYQTLNSTPLLLGSLYSDITSPFTSFYYSHCVDMLTEFSRAKHNHMLVTLLSTQHTISILGDMLDSSLLDDTSNTSQQIVLEPNAVAIGMIWEEVVKSLSKFAQEKNVRLLLDLSPFLHRDKRYIIDARRWKRVCRNLLLNLVFWAESGTLITIKAYPSTMLPGQNALIFQSDISFTTTQLLPSSPLDALTSAILELFKGQCTFAPTLTDSSDSQRGIDNTVHTVQLSVGVRIVPSADLLPDIDGIPSIASTYVDKVSESVSVSGPSLAGEVVIEVSGHDSSDDVPSSTRYFGPSLSPFQHFTALLLEPCTRTRQHLTSVLQSLGATVAAASTAQEATVWLNHFSFSNACQYCPPLHHPSRAHTRRTSHSTSQQLDDDSAEVDEEDFRRYMLLPKLPQLVVFVSQRLGVCDSDGVQWLLEMHHLHQLAWNESRAPYFVLMTSWYPTQTHSAHVATALSAEQDMLDQLDYETTLPHPLISIHKPLVISDVIVTLQHVLLHSDTLPAPANPLHEPSLQRENSDSTSLSTSRSMLRADEPSRVSLSESFFPLDTPISTAHVHAFMPLTTPTSSKQHSSTSTLYAACAGDEEAESSRTRLVTEAWRETSLTKPHVSRQRSSKK